MNVRNGPLNISKYNCSHSFWPSIPSFPVKKEVEGDMRGGEWGGVTILKRWFELTGKHHSLKKLPSSPHQIEIPLCLIEFPLISDWFNLHIELLDHLRSVFQGTLFFSWCPR